MRIIDLSSDVCSSDLFTLPAIVDRSPVIIAIGTGGASASLAKALRQWLEAMLPASLGGLAEALKTARAKVKARFADAGERRAFLDGLLMRGGPLDPLASHADPDATIKTALGRSEEHTSELQSLMRISSAVFCLKNK